MGGSTPGLACTPADGTGLDLLARPDQEACRYALRNCAAPDLRNPSLGDSGGAPKACEKSGPSQPRALASVSSRGRITPPLLLATPSVAEAQSVGAAGSQKKSRLSKPNQPPRRQPPRPTRRPRRQEHYSASRARLGIGWGTPKTFCRPCGAWGYLGRSGRGRRCALTPAYMPWPLWGL
jgi:hypothetical protein